MEQTQPRDMKKVTDNIRGYDHRVWLGQCQTLIKRGVQEKFRTNSGAKKYLLDTEDRLIGEATKNNKWGIGLHISDQKVLDTSEWVGENTMGEILMEVRKDMLAESQPVLRSDQNIRMPDISSCENEQEGDPSLGVTEPMEDDGHDPQASSTATGDEHQSVQTPTATNRRKVHQAKTPKSKSTTCGAL